MAAVDGSSGWQGEKTFFLNELKSPKSIMSFLFLCTFGGWVGVSGANVDKSTFF